MSDVETRIDLPLAEIAALCRRYQVLELSLFGSALTDDFGAESDLDLLVAFEPGTRVTFITFGRLEEALESLLGRKVDIVPKGGLKPLIRESVLASARVLYAA
jgi:predicted nucleotidyltransferase